MGTTLDVLVEEQVEGEDMSIGRGFLQAPDVDGLAVLRRRCAPAPRPARASRGGTAWTWRQRLSPENRAGRRSAHELRACPPFGGRPAHELGLAPYFEILNSEQRKAVVHQGAPLLILAGQGPGRRA